MLYDKDIREFLFEYLEDKYPKIRILEEKMVGDSRADIVMILPNEVVGIEIKSDADTYARLKRQVKDYDIFFDRNYVVVGSTHASHVREQIPEHWGILSVEENEDKVDFYMVREAEKNPNLLLKNKLTLLWRPELAHIQERFEMPVYKVKSKEFVREKILLKLDEETLNEQISFELFERDYTKIREEINAFREANGKKPRRRKKPRKKRASTAAAKKA